MLRETHKHELISFIFPYSATSSRGVASFLLFWRNNAHSQGKWIHFCSQVSIFIYIYTGILGTSDLALSFFSGPKWRACPYSLYFSFFCIFIKQLPPTEMALLPWLCSYRFAVQPYTHPAGSRQSDSKIWEIRNDEAFRLRNEHVRWSMRDNGGVSFVAFVTLNMSAC